MGYGCKTGPATHKIITLCGLGNRKGWINLMGSHKLGNIEHIQNIDGKIRSIEFLLHQIRAIIVYFVTFNIFKFLSSENERIQKLKFKRKVNGYTVINKNNV